MKLLAKLNPFGMKIHRYPTLCVYIHIHTVKGFAQRACEEWTRSRHHVHLSHYTKDAETAQVKEVEKKKKKKTAVAGKAATISEISESHVSRFTHIWIYIYIYVHTRQYRVERFSFFGHSGKLLAYRIFQIIPVISNTSLVEGFSFRVNVRHSPVTTKFHWRRKESLEKRSLEKATFFN